MPNRWDETWHRLHEWTNGQAPSERLAAQILLHECYESLDPSHPLGGKDGKRDALCQKNGQQWIMAVYFPRGQKDFKDIKDKFLNDLEGVKTNNADALVFVTNQELRLAERQELHESAENISVELFHLERITAILDKPEMHSIQKQFLSIDLPNQASNTVVTECVDTAWNLLSKFERLATKVADGTQNDPLGTQIQYEINDLAWELRLNIQRISNASEIGFGKALRDKADAVFQCINRKGSLQEIYSSISKLLETIQETA